MADKIPNQDDKHIPNQMGKNIPNSIPMEKLLGTGMAKDAGDKLKNRKQQLDDEIAKAGG